MLKTKDQALECFKNIKLRAELEWHQALYNYTLFSPAEWCGGEKESNGS
jgi:hypothetical protein